MQMAAELRLRKAESDLADRDISMMPGRAQACALCLTQTGAMQQLLSQLRQHGAAAYLAACSAA